LKSIAVIVVPPIIYCDRVKSPWTIHVDSLG
jgi:hypothetical protein